jgi:parvulin-like peptidyl-prolyl isomerase
MDFFTAAQHQFLASKGQTQHSLFTTIRRNQLTPPQATALFCAAPGAVVGPLYSGEGYEIVRVLHIEPACLDVPTCEAVKEKLFAEWLAVQRQEAAIEWFWGTADHVAHHTHGDLEQCASVCGGS